MNGLEIYECRKEGYQPVHDYNGWRVALTNYGERQSLMAVTEITRHLKTDEIFVLLKGSCTLYIGGNKEEITAIDTVPMEVLKLYNITKGTWHARSLTPGSTVLIVENEDTGAYNTEARPLTAEQLKIIRFQA